MLPASFIERRVRVFARDPQKQDAVQRAFASWQKKQFSQTLATPERQRVTPSPGQNKGHKRTRFNNNTSGNNNVNAQTTRHPHHTKHAPTGHRPTTHNNNKPPCITHEPRNAPTKHVPHYTHADGTRMPHTNNRHTTTTYA